MNKIHFFTVMIVEIFWGHYMTKTLGTLSNKLLNQCFSPFHPPNSIYYSDWVTNRTTIEIVSKKVKGGIRCIPGSPYLDPGLPDRFISQTNSAHSMVMALVCHHDKDGDATSNLKKSCSTIEWKWYSDKSRKGTAKLPWTLPKEFTSFEIFSYV